jgi:hypothetical protein
VLLALKVLLAHKVERVKKELPAHKVEKVHKVLKV